MADWALRRLMALAIVVLVTACSSGLVSPDVGRSASWSSTTVLGGSRQPLVIFVTRQGLFDDALVLEEGLDVVDDAQLLIDGRTDFGPGQLGYKFGRWWEDVNRNGVRDRGDNFFIAPLQLPGRIGP